MDLGHEGCEASVAKFDLVAESVGRCITIVDADEGCWVDELIKLFCTDGILGRFVIILLRTE